jgi:hypothetical protein
MVEDMVRYAILGSCKYSYMVTGNLSIDFWTQTVHRLQKWEVSVRFLSRRRYSLFQCYFVLFGGVYYGFRVYFSVKTRVELFLSQVMALLKISSVVVFHYNRT